VIGARQASADLESAGGPASNKTVYAFTSLRVYVFSDFETIEYLGVSRSTAEEFEKMIDTLCTGSNPLWP
jgi:hypothetical protein